ncbi:MAG: hypothetical protein IJ756_09020 [Paludibacteraceae bacterium]|nr:hypothetical protein [Paludibacteraceae bacterium]
MGNNLAVYNATLDSITQRTFYYPSGVPMSISTNRSEQPYKYSGKQFEQMNGYDAYKYEFRDYYATTARFTTPDPLADRTPHKSPYAYANNNFINETDLYGLFGDSFVNNFSLPTLGVTYIYGDGSIIAHEECDDHRVFMFDSETGEWNFIGFEVYDNEGNIVCYSGYDLNDFHIKPPKKYDQPYGETFTGGMDYGSQATSKFWGGLNDLGVYMQYPFSSGINMWGDIILRLKGIMNIFDSQKSPQETNNKIQTYQNDTNHYQIIIRNRYHKYGVKTINNVPYTQWFDDNGNLIHAGDTFFNRTIL